MNKKNEELFEKNLKSFKEKFAPNGEYFEKFIDCNYKDSFNELVEYNTELVNSYNSLLIRDDEKIDEEELRTNNRRFLIVQNEYKTAYNDMLNNVYYQLTNYLAKYEPKERDDLAYGLFQGLAKLAGLEEQHQELWEKEFSHGVFVR